MEGRYIESCSGSGLPILIPRRIGYIEFVSILGVGANAVVYEGRNVQTGESCACKAFNRKHITDDFQMYLIEQELRVSSLLRNPHIVSVKDTLYDDHVIILVMEKCRHSLLASLITGHPLSGERARTLFCEMLLVLEYLHARNMSHGDIKPDNLLFDERLNLKLADFGCVSVNGQNLYGGTRGTLLYMAPELIDDDGTIQDRRPGDIWALGIVFYAMSTGRLPWYDSTDEELIEQIKNPDFLYPDYVDKNVVDIISRCCALNCEDRPTVFELMNHMYLAETIQSLREKEWANSVPTARDCKCRQLLVRPIRQIHASRSDATTLGLLKGSQSKPAISSPIKASRSRKPQAWSLEPLPGMLRK